MHNWGLYLQLLALRILARLSPAGQRWVGRLLGLVLMRILGRRRRICEVNLRLCFPHCLASTRRALRDCCFESLGVSLLESALCCFHPLPRDLYSLQIRGRQWLEGERGRGTLILGPHLAAMEICISLLCRDWRPCAVVYRPLKHSLLDRQVRIGREAHGATLIPTGSWRPVIRLLEAGGTVWLAPDQDHGARHSVYAPFFGQRAATLRTLGRLVNRTRCRVLLMATWRQGAPGHYLVELQPLAGNYPTGDVHADAIVLNHAMEHLIRRRPEQYLWVHRRFKTRPPGERSLY